MTNKIWRFNKGEWTEAYVFLKLLSDGRIYGATNNFKKDSSKFIDILNILRTEMSSILKYERDNDSSTPKVHAYENDLEFAIITVPELSEKAAFLYSKLKEIPKEKTFDVPEIQSYLEKLKFSSPKVPKLPKDYEDIYGKKTDIIVTIIHSDDNSISTDGFSIKSHIGQPSSLFNSGEGSRLIFKIKNCTETDMHKINAIESETAMIQAIKNNKNLSLEFDRCGKEVFADNLTFIDTNMLKVITTAVLCQCHYLNPPKSNNIKDIVNVVAKYNPLGVKKPELFYEAKFKSFLFSSLAGLTASTEWDGKTRMTGGYIDVNKEGDLLYYRAISDEVFCSYLYENTFMDRPERGVNKDIAIAKSKAVLAGKKLTDADIEEVSKKNGLKKAKRGNWGYVYEEGNEYFFSINFQIRFR